MKEPSAKKWFVIQQATSQVFTFRKTPEKCGLGHLTPKTINFKLQLVINMMIVYFTKFQKTEFQCFVWHLKQTQFKKLGSNVKPKLKKNLEVKQK